MLKIGIVIGSTRPGRNGEAVARWVGSAGGARAVEQLRLVMAELQMATVRAQVMFSLANDFENYSVFRPQPQHEASLRRMLDQLVAWGEALKTIRSAQPAREPAAAR